MAGEATRTIQWDVLVEQHDPDRRIRPETEYTFGGGKRQFKRRPDRPGTTYHWVDE